MSNKDLTSFQSLLPVRVRLLLPVVNDVKPH